MYRLCLGSQTSRNEKATQMLCCSGQMTRFTAWTLSCIWFLNNLVKFSTFLKLGKCFSIYRLKFLLVRIKCASNCLHCTPLLTSSQDCMALPCVPNHPEFTLKRKFSTEIVILLVCLLDCVLQKPATDAPSISYSQKLAKYMLWHREENQSIFIKQKNYLGRAQS